jgi:hypothetical protein
MADQGHEREPKARIDLVVRFEVALVHLEQDVLQPLLLL